MGVENTIHTTVIIQVYSLKYTVYFPQYITPCHCVHRRASYSVCESIDFSILTKLKISCSTNAIPSINLA